MDYYTELPTNLIENIKNRKSILFVGAGISRKCISKGRKPLSNWYEFLRGFIIWKNRKYKLDKEYYNELKLLLDQGKYLLVAEELLENVPESEFKEYLDSVFDPQNILPSYLHSLIPLIPFRGIITTNYENLIELSYVNTHKRMPKIYTNTDILNGANPFDSEYFIFKMHGDIENPRSIVISQRSYAEMLYNSPDYRNLLENIFLDYTILFIGYGGKDPNVESVIDKISIQKKHSRHYILSKEENFTGIEKNRFKKDKNIKVIEYIDYFGLHNHIDTFFFDLLKKVASKEILNKVPAQLRSRIYVFYDKIDTDDGYFLWNYFFRHGAITLHDGAQKEQDGYFLNKFDETDSHIDFLVFFFGNLDFNKRNPFYKKVLTIYNNIDSYKFQLILISLNKNRSTVNREFLHANKFFIKENFIDIDLENVKNYITNLMD